MADNRDEASLRVPTDHDDSAAKPEGDFCGLLSPGAELLYAKLAATTGMSVGCGPGRFDVEGDAARELLEAEIAYRGPFDYDRVRVVSQATAFQLLLARRHREIDADYSAVLEGWARLGSLLDSAAAIPGGTEHDPGSLVLVLTDPQDVAQISAQLATETAAEVRRAVRYSTVDTGGPDDDSARSPDGVNGSSRALYDGQLMASQHWRGLMQNAQATGTQVRVRRSLPVNLLCLDSRIALITLPIRSRRQALLVRSAHLVGLLRDWYDLMWSDSTTVNVGTSGQTSLPTAQQQVLRLLAAGMTDEAIASASGLTVRTVRRHVSQLLETLEAPSRFAAGVAAAKRGWI